MRQVLSMFTLGVQDLARSVDFYERVLEWKRSSQSHEGSIAFFDLGGFLLGLYPRKALAEDANVSPQGSGFSGVTLSHNVGSKAEVNAVLQRVKERGGRVIKEPQELFWGGYGGYIEDPDGYPMEIVFNPFWDIDRNGHVVLPEEKPASD